MTGQIMLRTTIEEISLRERAVQIYSSGRSMNATAKAAGVTGPTIARWLSDAGIVPRYRRPVYPDAVRIEAVRRYVELEQSAASVARAMGLKTFTVKDWIKEAGVTRTMSEAASIDLQRGRLRGLPARRIFFQSTKTGEGHYAESLYELRRMIQLDSDPLVVSWARCRDRIRYTHPSGSCRHYIPDFDVIGTLGGRRVEEVKPGARIFDPVNLAKIRAASAFYAASGVSFLVVDEVALGGSIVIKASSPPNVEPDRKLRTKQRRHRRVAEMKARETAEEADARRAAHAARRKANRLAAEKRRTRW